MITRYSVWMNNRGLQDIDPAIYITDIREKEPKQQMITMPKAWGNGLRFIRAQRQSLSVVIRFAIRERDTVRRRDICTRIRSWAQEGYLTTSDRPGQRLYVVCEKIPTVSSALKWAEEMEMTLTSYDVPWWETINPSTCTASADTLNSDGMYSDEVTMRMIGDVESPLNATITASGALDQLSIHLDNDQFIAFSDLGMQSGDVLTINHDKNGILTMMLGDTSMMSKRTAQSYDDLMIQSGKGVVITLTAEAACTATFSVRGRYV